MPWKPQQHRPHGVERRREPENRKTSRERGYDWQWQQAADAWKKENPLCAECLRHERLTPVYAVDHIKPHRGDKELFWDRSQWQSLCRSCHSIKTRMEANLDKYTRTVVCGPPLAGKTTYVQQRRKAGEWVWDWDYVAREITGNPLHTPADKDATCILDAMVNVMCEQIAARPPAMNVWLIISDPLRAQVVAERISGQVIELGMSEEQRATRFTGRYGVSQ